MNNNLLSQNFKEIDQATSAHALEHGKILFFPDYYFHGVDSNLLNEAILDGSRKNISYHSHSKTLSAYNHNIPDLKSKLSEMMQNFAEFSYSLIQAALPSYTFFLRYGRTSFRPAQVDGRVISKRKDDTRLHVDSFSASPVHGYRILRVFCNINPCNEPRIWHIGEPFSNVLERFAPQIKPYSKVQAKILHVLKITKSLRSAYDHYMLHLHDRMKLDDYYQKDVKKKKVEFPAKSSWIVFTDQVSHAALSGQHLLEQTFYLPVNSMVYPECSPLHQLSKIKPDINERSGCLAI